MCEKIRAILKDRRGVSFPLVIGVTLVLVIIFCGVSEYFRLQIIAIGVRDAVEDAIISTVNDNYAGVYHGVREGYSGGYMPDGDADWETAVSEGDIYTHLDATLGTERWSMPSTALPLPSATHHWPPLIRRTPSGSRPMR